jgi:TPR repeat protein
LALAGLWVSSKKANQVFGAYMAGDMTTYMEWAHLSDQTERGFKAYGVGDYSQAIKEYTPLAEKGDFRAQNILGDMYRQGIGVSQDYTEALKWYELSAEQGYTPSQSELGSMYGEGKGVALNYKEAAKWYRLAEASGVWNDDKSADKISRLILLYEGLAAYEADNYSLAINKLQPLAEKGDASAQYALGNFYRLGGGLKQDYAEALKWLRLAASPSRHKKGLANAQKVLGWLYHKGTGVHKDYVRSMEWYRRAARQGDTFSQQELALMYRYGEGVPKSYIMAYIWYDIAFTNGLKIAGEWRDQIASKMSPDDIFKAKTMAQECLSNDYMSNDYMSNDYMGPPCGY